MQWRKEIDFPKMFQMLFVFGIVLFVVSLYSHSAILFVTFILITIVYYGSHYYLTRIGSEFQFDNEKQVIRMFADENDKLTFTFKLFGFLPITSGNIKLRLDNNIVVENLKHYEQKHTIEYEIPFSLMSKEQLELPLEINSIRRGAAKVRSIEVRIDNIFGLGSVTLYFDSLVRTEILVFPSPISVGGLNKMKPKEQGYHPSNFSLMEDQTSPVGTRNYVSSDPFNRVHWKATARTQTLQTKIFEKTAKMSWTFVINITDESNGRSYSVSKDLELIVSHLAYMCHLATEKKIPYEMYFNVRIPGKTSFLHLPLGEGKEQLAKALELLCRLSFKSVMVPFSRLSYYLDRHHARSPYVIHQGDINNEAKTIYLKWSKQGTTILSIDREEETTFVRPFNPRRNIS
jgi:uncharacterized protein (DUF58 family)